MYEKSSETVLDRSMSQNRQVTDMENRLFVAKNMMRHKNDQIVNQEASMQKMEEKIN